jgi:hypothetical protein
LVWDEPDPVYADSPSTKIERSLREQFHLPPVPELSRYCCTIRAGDREHAAALLAPIPRPRLLLHYQGASVRENKTLDEQVARSIIEQAQGAGWSVILHDFGQSKLVDLPGVRNFGAGHPLWQGHRYGHGSMMIALSSLCDYHVDIDSGPGHCLACTDTPGAIVWTRHHPLHFYCLAPNVLHWVPQSHERYIRGYCDEDVEIGARYFREHYRALYYRHQRVDLPDLVLHQLKRVEPKERLCQLPSASPR